MTIRPMNAEDGARVLEIYAEGVRGGNATFETETPDWEAFDKEHLEVCRLVAEENRHVIGWAALLPSSQRCAYRGVAELSVYVAQESRGKGVGKMLLQRLVEQSERNGFWTLLAGILRENTASARLHESVGFRLVGHNERVGQLHGVWRDVLRYERRSNVVGN